MGRTWARAVYTLVVIGAVTGAGVWLAPPAPWSDEELAVLNSLHLANLPPLPADTTNRVADDPRAQALGKSLFFDARLSGNGAVSCATCHQPVLRFTDRQPVSRAIGISGRNAPSIVGTAYSPWLYWDGRKDSLWSQALSPLEDPAEHGGNRMRYVRLIAEDASYREQYEALFGPIEDFADERRFPADAAPVEQPEWNAAWNSMSEADRTIVNRAFANIGKAIAAYERLLLPAPSRFDAYVSALSTNDEAGMALLTDAQVRGLRLFIGAGGCTQCHNGPLFTNNAFHNTGLLPRSGTLPDKGRALGLRKAQTDPFNCLSPFSDDPGNCAELEFANTGPENIGAVRTPSLRNLAGTQPYAHAGQQADLDAVLAHYNDAPDALIGHNEAKPLGLWPWQLADLRAFLSTLEAPMATPPEWLAAP